MQARRRGGGGSRGSNEAPLDVNNGGLKTQTVDFLLFSSKEWRNGKQTLSVVALNTNTEHPSKSLSYGPEVVGVM